MKTKLGFLLNHENTNNIAVLSAAMKMIEDEEIRKTLVLKAKINKISKQISEQMRNLSPEELSALVTKREALRASIR